MIKESNIKENVLLLYVYTLYIIYIIHKKKKFINVKFLNLFFKKCNFLVLLFLIIHATYTFKRLIKIKIYY